MAKLKNFDEFCNESLILSSEYNYYGPGSLVPMIKQLVREGKDSSIIRSYLTSLGVEAWRIDKAMSEFEVAFGGEKKVNESNAILKLAKDFDVEFAEEDFGVQGEVANLLNTRPGMIYILGGSDSDQFSDYNSKEKKLVHNIESDTVENGKKSQNKQGDTYYTKDNVVVLEPKTGAYALFVGESVNEGKKIKETFSEKAGKFLTELDKATFEDAANAFLLDLPGSDEVTEKLNKETLQVEEGDG